MSSQLVCDVSSLSCDHHSVMLVLMCLINPNGSDLANLQVNACLLGLGAGLLASFLINRFNKVWDLVLLLLPFLLRNYFSNFYISADSVGRRT